MNVIEEEIAQGLAEDRVELESTGILHEPPDQVLQLAHYALCAEYKTRKSINQPHECVSYTGRYSLKTLQLDLSSITTDEQKINLHNFFCNQISNYVL